MKIQLKLLIAFLSLTILSSVGGVFSFFTLDKSSDYLKSKEEVYKVLAVLKEIQKVEKDFLQYGWKEVDFLEDGVSDITKRHKELLQELSSINEHLKDEEIIKDNNLAVEVYNIQNTLSKYESDFNNLKALLLERGFKDHGLEGSMRGNVHELQESKSPQEQVFAFSLRRHEKDFMLRSDMKYVERLNNTASEFIEFISSSNQPHMTRDYKRDRIAVIDAYVKKFNKLVELEEAIGLSNSKGVKGELKISSNAILPTVNALLSKVDENTEKLQSKARVILGASILVPLILGVLISLIFTRTFAGSIVALNNSIKNIIKGKKGDLKKLDNINSKDEIGELARNFKSMMESINQHMKEISDKNAALQQTAIEDGKRKWIAEGVASLSDLMKEHDEDLDEFSYQVISSVVKHVNANQGGIFFVDNIEQPTKMVQKACFAYDRKKFVAKEVLKGEGVISAAWLEKEYVLMTDIPQNYVSITSGLGEATPNSLLVVPMINDGKVYGAIELASFSEIDEYQIEFVNKIAERIAGMYYSMVSKEKTRELLEQTKLQAKEMSAQEEELRQNMEEIQTTQEEMQRKQIETETVRKMLENIIDLVPYPVFVKDHEGKYSLVNKAEALLYNTVAERMIGKGDDELINNVKELANIRHSDNIVLDSKEELRLPEQTITFPNGEQKMLQTIKVPFVNPLTQKLNILGVSIDMTDVRNVQKELKFTRDELRKAHGVIDEIKTDFGRAKGIGV